MAEPNLEHVKILRSGVEKWNRWREENPEARPDLSGARFLNADLSHADLNRADFSHADLSNADLNRAEFWNADLSNADLTNAKLSHAKLVRANFTGADLTNANLSHADLGHADFSGANLTSATLSATDLWETVLKAADLSDADLGHALVHAVDVSQVKGLGTAKHRLPSVISPKTLEMSKGRIPDEFLKGCGLWDWEILAAKLHDRDLSPDQVVDITYRIADLRTHAPIVPLSVFISYAHEDKAFATKVEERLDKDGIRSWRDVRHMVAGPMEAQVDRAISIHGALLLILSAHSVNSDWVRWEAEKARKLEQDLEAEAGGERRHRLCPVALDDSWKTCRWPERLRTQIEDYSILDFSRWEDDEDDFEAQYEKLKTGLGIYYRK